MFWIKQILIFYYFINVRITTSTLIYTKEGGDMSQNKVLDEFLHNSDCVQIWLEESSTYTLTYLMDKVSKMSIPYVFGMQHDVQCFNHIFIVEQDRNFDFYGFSNKKLRDRNRKHVFILTQNYELPEMENYKDIFGYSQVATVNKTTTYILDPPMYKIRTFHEKKKNEIIWNRIDSTEYLKGGIVRVSTFHCPLFSIISNNKGQLTGIEGEMVKEATRRLNLTLELVPITSKYGSKFGYRQQNRSWSGGVMWELARGRADVGFCNFWIYRHPLTDVEFTACWGMVKQTFLVPRPHVVASHWLTMFRPLQPSTWAAVLSALIITSVTRWALTKLSSTLSDTKYRTDLASVLVGMFGALTQSSTAVSKGRRCPLLSSWHVVCVILVSGYSSQIVTRLTLPLYTPQIDTVRQLVQDGFSSGSTIHTILSTRLNRENMWHEQFKNSFKKVDEDELHRLLETEKLAIPIEVYEESFVFSMDLHKVREKELAKLRVMKEVINTHYISMRVRRGSPLFPAWNTQILRLLSTGLVQHWERNVTLHHGDKANRELMRDRDGPTFVEPEPLRLSETAGVFYTLAAGLAVAGGVFCGELYAHWSRWEK